MQNLRREDMGRETLVHLDSCRMESERLAELEEEYKQTMNGLGNHSRDFLERYIEQMQSKAFVEQQQAYLQGMLDAFQILFGLGVISSNQNVEKIIAHLKNDSPK